jgi:hypothetical protein
MDIRNEIVTRLDRLPPEMQGQVLRFVSSLTALPPKGERAQRYASSPALSMPIRRSR